MNTDTASRSPWSILLARWPSAVGLLVIAGSSAGGVDAHIVAMIIIIAALCYLAAAAIGHRRSGWIMVGIATVAVLIAMVTAIDAIVMLLVAAPLFVLVGLIRRPRDAWPEIGLQSAAFVAFAAIALTAMMVDPILAAHLAGLAAIGHGVWDVIHHRRDKVVTRSFTEFCAVLDFGLGILILVATWIGLAL